MRRCRLPSAYRGLESSSIGVLTDALRAEPSREVVQSYVMLCSAMLCSVLFCSQRAPGHRVTCARADSERMDDIFAFCSVLCSAVRLPATRRYSLSVSYVCLSHAAAQRESAVTIAASFKPLSRVALASSSAPLRFRAARTRRDATPQPVLYCAIYSLQSTVYTVKYMYE